MILVAPAGIKIPVLIQDIKHLIYIIKDSYLLSHLNISKTTIVSFALSTR